MLLQNFAAAPLGCISPPPFLFTCIFLICSIQLLVWNIYCQWASPGWPALGIHKRTIFRLFPPPPSVSGAREPLRREACAEVLLAVCAAFDGGQRRRKRPECHDAGKQGGGANHSEGGPSWTVERRKGTRGLSWTPFFRLCGEVTQIGMWLLSRIWLNDDWAVTGMHFPSPWGTNT